MQLGNGYLLPTSERSGELLSKLSLGRIRTWPALMDWDMRNVTLHCYLSLIAMQASYGDR